MSDEPTPEEINEWIADTMDAPLDLQPAHSPTYDKLRQLIWEALYPGDPMYSPANTAEIRSMYKNVDNVLDAIWPEILQMMVSQLTSVQGAYENTYELAGYFNFIESDTPGVIGEVISRYKPDFAHSSSIPVYRIPGQVKGDD